MLSIISLFILILTQNCLTLPIVDEQSSTSTFSPLNNELTTQYGMNFQSGNDDQTTLSLNIEAKRSSNGEHFGLDVSTSSSDLLEENSSRSPEIFGEHSTIELLTGTTEKSLDNQNDQNNFLFTTIDQFERRNIDTNSEDKVSTETTEVELTTDKMTSKLPNVGDEFHVSKLSTLKPTVKHTDYHHNEENDKLNEKDKTKSKFENKTTKNSKIESDENSRESTTKTSASDKQILQKIPDVPNNVMTLVEDDEMIVTIENRLLTSSTNDKYEENPLNQGEKSSYDKEKESNN